MVLFRALGWLLLTLGVAALVNDCLSWWSEGVFRLLTLGELWSRLDFGSLHAAQGAIAAHARGLAWAWIATPILALPALPTFGVAGGFFLWLGRRAGNRSSERSFIKGSRPPRRRRYRRGLS
jgi:hypothetical protein